MSKKIEIIGNFLIVTDTVSGERSRQPIPAKEMTWLDLALEETNPRIVFETTRFLSDSTEFELYPPFTLSVAVDSSLVAFTKSTFRDFCTSSLGKSSGGSSSIPTGGIFNGGFVDDNTVFVDFVDGNDATGRFDDKAFPYKNLTAALSALAASSKSYWVVDIVDVVTHTITSIPRKNITFKKINTGKIIVERLAASPVITLSGVESSLYFDMPNAELELKTLTSSVVLNAEYVSIEFNIDTVRMNNVVGQGIYLHSSKGIYGNIQNLIIAATGMGYITTDPTGKELIIEYVELNSNGNCNYAVNAHNNSSTKKVGKISINNCISLHKRNKLFLLKSNYPSMEVSISKIVNATIFYALTTSTAATFTVNFESAHLENWSLLKTTSYSSNSSIICTGIIQKWGLDGYLTSIIPNEYNFREGTNGDVKVFMWNVKTLDFEYKNPEPPYKTIALFSNKEGLNSSLDGKGVIFLNAEFHNCPIPIFGESVNSSSDTDEDKKQKTRLILKGTTILDGTGDIIGRKSLIGAAKRIEVQGQLILGDRMNAIDPSKVEIIKTFTII